MSQKIDGIKVLVYVDDTAIAESLSASIEFSTNEIDTTTKSSGGWSEMLPGVRSWSITDNGLKEWGTASGNTATLEDTWINRTKIAVKFATADSGDRGFQGDAYITSLSESADIDSGATYDVTITGTGPISTFTVT